MFLVVISGKVRPPVEIKKVNDITVCNFTVITNDYDQLKENKNLSYIRCSLWNNDDIIKYIESDDHVIVKGSGSIKKYKGSDGIVRDVFNLRAQSVELNGRLFYEGVIVNE